MSLFMSMVLFVNARIVLGRFASHVIFNPEEGKADEDFNYIVCCCSINRDGRVVVVLLLVVVLLH